jgi:hypothetical protein
MMKTWVCILCGQSAQVRVTYHPQEMRRPVVFEICGMCLDIPGCLDAAERETAQE